MTTDELKDLTIITRQTAWQYRLERYSTAELKKIDRIVSQVQDELDSYLSSGRGGAAGRGRKKALKEEMDRLFNATQSTLRSSMESSATAVGIGAANEYSNILSFNGAGKAVNFVALSPDQMKALLDTSIRHKALNNWLTLTYPSKQIERMKDELLVAAFKGESAYNMSRRLSETFDMTRREAKTLALTYMAEANNIGIKAVYDANADVLKGEEWSATLEVNRKEGKGTCLRCAALDGRVYPLDEPHIRPPLHPRCRCFMIPKTKSYRELGLDVDDIERVARPYQLKKGGKVQKIGHFQGGFDKWLFTQPEKYQLDLLGPNRLRLIQEGKIKFEDLIDDYGNLRLLKRTEEGFTGLLPASSIIGATAAVPSVAATREATKIADAAVVPTPDTSKSSLFQERLQKTTSLEEIGEILAEQGVLSPHEMKKTFGVQTAGFKKHSVLVDAATVVSEEFDQMMSVAPRMQEILDESPLRYLGIQDSSTFGSTKLYFSGFDPEEIRFAYGVYVKDYKEMAITRAKSGKSWLKETKTGLGGNLVDPTARGTFRHEYGHHIFDHSPRPARSEWVALFKKSSGIDWKKVSRYATTNKDEAFAEAWSTWTSKSYKTMKKKLPKQVEEFFEKHYGEVNAD